MNTKRLKTTVTGVGLALLLASGAAAAHQPDRAHRHAGAPAKHHGYQHYSDSYAWMPRHMFGYLGWERQRDLTHWRKDRRKIHRRAHRKAERRYYRATRDAYREGYRAARKDYRHKSHDHRARWQVAKHDYERDRHRDGKRDRKRDRRRHDG